VPLTFDQTIQQTCAAHADALSAADVGRWRVVWTSSELVEEKAIVDEDADGDAPLATIKDDPNTSGTQYTLVEYTSDVSLVDSGAKAGDILRAKYTTDGFGSEEFSEFVIDAILSETSLRLVSGPSAAVNTASRAEIHRNLSDDEVATETGANAQVFSNRRVRHVMPDLIEADGGSSEGFFLAAALAGLRSGIVPHQGMTNLAIAGFDSVPRITERFTKAQLDTMANAGVWIVTQEPAGQIFTRHALTTDVTDLNSREEVIVSNIDSVSYTFLSSLAPFIGVSNISPALLDQIEVELQDVIDSLTNAEVSTPKAGAQLLPETNIVSVTVHPTSEDRVVAIIDIVRPAPLNNLELHLVI
jgi:hypothetical protein